MEEAETIRPPRITLPRGDPTLEATAAGERTLAQAERLRCDLEQLVLADPLQTLLEIHDARRGELDALVGRRGAHVGELLFLGDVDVEVVVAAVLAGDHALVDLFTRAQEHHAARLEVVDRVARRAARAVGDEGAALTVGDIALPLVPAVEEVVEQTSAASIGEELGAIADQSAGRNAVFQPHTAGAVIHHLGHDALAGTDLLGDGADELLGNVDHEVLHRLQGPATL